MSILLGHIKAARAMGAALKGEAENAASFPQNAELLHLIGAAHLAAADAMEASERESCAGRQREG